MCASTESQRKKLTEISCFIISLNLPQDKLRTSQANTIKAEETTRQAQSHDSSPQAQLNVT